MIPETPEPPSPPENERDFGPPQPPLRIIAIVIMVAVVLAIALSGCVQARIAAYYAPPKPGVCEIPVYDGPREEGKLLKCLSRAEWSAP